MTRGALIFAFDNEEINYLAMAAWCANNIKRHLGVDVAVVTDNKQAHQNSAFDYVIDAIPLGGTSKRYFDDIGGSVSWHNANRIDAYHLSPFDQTLVLDADYVVASDQLTKLFCIPNEFVCHRWAYDVTGIDNFEDLNYFGRHKMPMSWATVMYFNKCKLSESIFEMMTMIKNNWQHYRNLYGIAKSTYRNDHALSIALNTLFGHTTQHPEIPWQLASLVPAHKLTQLNIDQYRVDFETSDKKKKFITLINQDFHAMGKKHLGDIIANHS
jgi:hypothetical protein